jgi:hypothetical protein
MYTSPELREQLYIETLIMEFRQNSYDFIKKNNITSKHLQLKLGDILYLRGNQKIGQRRISK